jgi:hypothetical protein
MWSYTYIYQLNISFTICTQCSYLKLSHVTDSKYNLINGIQSLYRAQQFNTTYNHPDRS